MYDYQYKCIHAELMLIVELHCVVAFLILICIRTMQSTPIGHTIDCFSALDCELFDLLYGKSNLNILVEMMWTVGNKLNACMVHSEKLFPVGL